MLPIVQPELFGVTNAPPLNEHGLFAEIVLNRPLEGFRPPASVLLGRCGKRPGVFMGCQWETVLTVMAVPIGA